jgi:SAM-dependent methyltransferase
MGWWSERVVPRVVDKALKGKETGALRDRVCAGLHGRILEVGFGGGLNIRSYPPEVTAVDAVEPSALGWELSERRRARTALPIERVGLDGERLDAEDATYDGALVTFTLCTIPDAVAALREVRRVLKPGAGVHFLEHGAADEPRVAAWQRRLDPIQRLVAGGCHLTRDPAALADQAGLEVVALERFRLPDGAAPWAAGYLGRAVRPG